MLTWFEALHWSTTLILHFCTPLSRGFLCQPRPFRSQAVYWSTFKDQFRTAQKTLSDSVIKTSQLMLFREIIAVFSQIHTKHINTLCGQNVELLNVKLVVHIVITGFYKVERCGKVSWVTTSSVVWFIILAVAGTIQNFLLSTAPRPAVRTT